MQRAEGTDLTKYKRIPVSCDHAAKEKNLTETLVRIPISVDYA